MLAVDELRDTLSLSSDAYLAGDVHARPIEFIAHGALEEASKAMVCLENGIDDLQLTDREDLELVCEQLALRCRRLCESHLMVTLFGVRRDAALARHYLLLRKWSALRTENLHLGEYHGRESHWIEQLTSEAATLVDAASGEISHSEAWYIAERHRKNFTLARHVRRPFGVFSSTAQQIKDALPVLEPQEKFAIGTSYEEAFGNASAVIHMGLLRPRTGKILVDAHYWHIKINLLSFALLRRLHYLLGAPASLRAAKSGTTPEAIALIEDLALRPKVQVGMRVVAHGLTGTVISEATSLAGNRSVEIEFAPERPSPLVPRDWLAVRFVLPA